MKILVANIEIAKGWVEIPDEEIMAMARELSPRALGEGEAGAAHPVLCEVPSRDACSQLITDLTMTDCESCKLNRDINESYTAKYETIRKWYARHFA